MFSPIDERMHHVTPPTQYVALKSGRDLSNYVRPHTITENIKHKLGLTNNEELRQYLKENADKLIDAENAFWQSNMNPWTSS